MNALPLGRSFSFSTSSSSSEEISSFVQKEISLSKETSVWLHWEMWSSFSSIMAMSLALVWVDTYHTSGIAISVLHVLELSINRFSLSVSSISTLVWIASSISWRLVEQNCLLSVIFFFWVGFVYEKIVGTAFSVKSFLVDIPRNSFWREEKIEYCHKIDIQFQHINELNTMVEKYY